MIRTLLRPDTQNISIMLPQNFVGKQVEVIVFTIDETVSEPKTNDDIQTHYASHAVLAKDWSTPEEDIAWEDL